MELDNKDLFEKEEPYKHLEYYEGAVFRLPTVQTLCRSLGLLAMMLGVAWLGMNEVTRPPHKVPWWFPDSQYDWEQKHRIVPKGYDNVSRYFISCEGITCTPASWGEEQTFWTSTLNCRLKLQMIDDKLLIRTTDGKTGLFNGNEQIHLPLQGIDPEADCKLPAGKKLLECLHPDDDGLVLAHEEKPGFSDMLRAEGLLDESTRK